MSNGSASNVIRRKLVIIGDGACGKTSLLSVFTLGYFPTVCSCFLLPQILGLPQSRWHVRSLIIRIALYGKSVQLALWDTAGQEDYERLRPLAYSKAHVILIGFSVDTPDSLDNVKHKWIEEATRLCEGVPIILVGLKKDLRDDPVAIEEMRKKSQRFVTAHDGEGVAREIGAKRYLECSSLSGEGVDDVFEAATRAALLTFEKGETTGCCVVL
ncbi:GTP-binding protein rho2 [Trichoderma gamsii]|uniref:GTP-binding protein rho2 n=1 Tax=Trichoderma gamsii TaxID=398673 RepID=A0A2P4ZND9_9HYPO|nr:GTP-binding protein rho2 [Trichoderma gamsii]PON25803.1 GTP-binding protein rho2 [Trichoderma gamsii]